MEVGLGYGIENHFAGAERLSTYWGYGGTSGYEVTYGCMTVVDVDWSFTVGVRSFVRSRLLHHP